MYENRKKYGKDGAAEKGQIAGMFARKRGTGVRGGGNHPSGKRLRAPDRYRRKERGGAIRGSAWRGKALC